MAECKACGREAGPNKVYCGDACYELGNPPRPNTAELLADAYTRGRNDEASARQAQTQNELRLIARVEELERELELEKIKSRNERAYIAQFMGVSR